MYAEQYFKSLILSMAIFGYYNASSPKSVWIHEQTPLDILSNYIFAAFLILTFFFSSLLNPLSFLYHYNQRSTFPTILFQLLAISDFLTNIYRPIDVTYQLLKPGISHLHSENTRILFYPLTLTSILLRNTSSMIVAVLSLSRYIAVKNPFYKIKKLHMRLMFWAMGMFIVCDVMFYTYYFLTINMKWERYLQLLWPSNNTLSVWVYSVFASIQELWLTIGVFISILTIYELWKYRPGSDQCSRRAKKRSALNIFLMNLANIPVMVLWEPIVIEALTGRNRNNHYHVLGFVISAFLPMFLSGFNPVIILACSADFKQWVRGRGTVRTRRTGRPSMASVTSRVSLWGSMPVIVRTSSSETYNSANNVYELNAACLHERHPGGMSGMLSTQTSRDQLCVPAGPSGPVKRVSRESTVSNQGTFHETTTVQPNAVSDKPMSALYRRSISLD